MGRRIRWLGAVMVVCFALALVQLVNIQVVKAPGLRASAANPRNEGKQYDNQRGDIYAVRRHAARHVRPVIGQRLPLRPGVPPRLAVLAGRRVLLGVLRDRRH